MALFVLCHIRVWFLLLVILATPGTITNYTAILTTQTRWPNGHWTCHTVFRVHSVLLPVIFFFKCVMHAAFFLAICSSKTKDVHTCTVNIYTIYFVSISQRRVCGVSLCMLKHSELLLLAWQHHVCYFNSATNSNIIVAVAVRRSSLSSAFGWNCYANVAHHRAFVDRGCYAHIIMLSVLACLAHTCVPYDKFVSVLFAGAHK